MPFLTQAVEPEAFNTVVFACVGSPTGLVACYLLLINLITFLVFGWDKWKAKWKEHHESARRVPEKTLFVLSAMGGSIGALLGMNVFHHKTLHKSFRFGIPGILFLQLLVALGIWIYFNQRGAAF